MTKEEIVTISNKMENLGYKLSLIEKDMLGKNSTWNIIIKNQKKIKNIIKHMPLDDLEIIITKSSDSYLICMYGSYTFKNKKYVNLVLFWKKVFHKKWEKMIRP